MRKCIGVDIGGTEIKGAIISEDFSFCLSAREKTNASGGINAITAALDCVIAKLLKSGAEVDGIGVASAGNIDINAGKVIYATDNLPGYTGFDIKGHISKKFNLPCVAENDAYAALVGEINAGAAKGFNSAVMLTLGTGVGGAIAFNGEIMHGSTFMAGRLGHAILVPNGKKCNCGQNGCVEQFLSGTAFTKGAKDLGYDIKHGSKIFALIKQGDKVLEKYLIEYLGLLADFIDTIINFVNPEVIIIGGGLATTDFWFSDYFLPMVKNKSVIVKKAMLENTAGIIGAAAVWFKNAKT